MGAVAAKDEEMVAAARGRSTYASPVMMGRAAAKRAVTKGKTDMAKTKLNSRWEAVAEHAWNDAEVFLRCSVIGSAVTCDFPARTFRDSPPPWAFRVDSDMERWSPCASRRAVPT